MVLFPSSEEVFSQDGKVLEERSHTRSVVVLENMRGTCIHSDDQVSGR